MAWNFVLCFGLKHWFKKNYNVLKSHPLHSNLKILQELYWNILRRSCRCYVLFFWYKEKKTKQMHFSFHIKEVRQDPTTIRIYKQLINHLGPHVVICASFIANFQIWELFNFQSFKNYITSDEKHILRSGMR